MQETVRERLIKFYESKGLTKKAFEKKCGLSNGYMDKLRNCPSPQKLESIYLSFPELNRIWLLTGEGEMTNNETTIIPTDISRIPGILPEIEFKFAAGQTLLIGEGRIVNRYWYLPDCRDCEAVVPIQGTSMQPDFPAGCFAAMKRYNIPNNNPNAIPFGQVFGIVVEDEVTGEWHGYVKVLRRHKDPDTAKNYWIAHSFNPDFDDFDIPLSQVKSLWIVKQHIVNDVNY